MHGDDRGPAWPPLAGLHAGRPVDLLDGDLARQAVWWARQPRPCRPAAVNGLQEGTQRRALPAVAA
jgi:hypothetical protein